MATMRIGSTGTILQLRSFTIKMAKMVRDEDAINTTPIGPKKRADCIGQPQMTTQMIPCAIQFKTLGGKALKKLLSDFVSGVFSAEAPSFEKHR